MKQIRSIFTAIVMTATTLSASAQNPVSLSDDDGQYSINTGYKGFIDIGYGIGVGDLGEDRFEVLTSHGYQFNPYLYIGIGFGISYYHKAELWNLPVFGNIRGTLPVRNSRVTPFVDLKIGYSAIDVEGFYCSPSVGLRIATGARTGLNIGIGYEMQKTEFYMWTFGSSWTSRENCGAFTIRIGYDI